MKGYILGAMAGTLDIIQRCYTGLEIRDDVIWFNPRLPKDIESMSFQLRYRGHWMKLKINHQKLDIRFDKGWANPVTIGVKQI
jgi:trehalose/maltose hydrolase-like predicted phosphorylase